MAEGSGYPVAFMVALGTVYGAVFLASSARIPHGQPVPTPAAPVVDPLPPTLDNTARARVLAERVAPQDARAASSLKMQLAIERLRSGETMPAIESFKQLVSDAEASAGGLTQNDLRGLLHLLAVAYMRQGEEQNCVAHHGPGSCLFPIDETGVHQDPWGSSQAMDTYRRILAIWPDDLEARWLLNTAAMTLGVYPDGVPSEFVLPPTAFESASDLGRFANVASERGVDTMGLAGGVVAGDFDGDGDTDLVVSEHWVASGLTMLLNQGDGSFAESRGVSGLKDVRGGLQLTQADYDNDGDLDIYVQRGGWLFMEEAGFIPDSLLQNDGSGHFADVAEEVGLALAAPTGASAWADYDGDGDLDLFVGEEGTDERSTAHLYRYDGDEGFIDVWADIAPPISGIIKGAAWGDFDNDGRPDLYISRFMAPNVLFRNQQDGRLVDVTEAAGVGEPLASFPTWWFDHDHDGDLDLFVSGYTLGPPQDTLPPVGTPFRPSSLAGVAADYLGAKTDVSVPRLFQNESRDGVPVFRDVAAEVGLAAPLLTMGCGVGDLDNDGWLDIYFATGTPNLRALMPNRMFRNREGGWFDDVTTSGGFGHLQKGHGVSFVDLDEDGDLDVFTVMGGWYETDAFSNVLFDNPGHGHAWVGLSLVGTESNRAAIGARVAVTVRGENGRHVVHRMVGPGTSFGGNPLRLHIGLGLGGGVEAVEVRWPGSDNQQVWPGLEAGTTWVLTEGESEATRMAVGAP